jgi:hypothetical protein
MLAPQYFPNFTLICLVFPVFLIFPASSSSLVYPLLDAKPKAIAARFYPQLVNRAKILTGKILNMRQYSLLVHIASWWNYKRVESIDDRRLASLAEK